MSENNKEVNITKLVSAPRDVVFDMFVKQEFISKWWGPKGFTNPVCEIDAQTGGKIYIEVTGPDGTVYPMRGTFHEIIRPSLLVFSSTAVEDTKGKPQLENVNTITFTDEDDKTKLSLHAVVIKAESEAAEAVDGMEEGWAQSFERLSNLINNR